MPITSQKSMINTLNWIASQCPPSDHWCHECDRPKMSSSHTAHNLRAEEWQECVVCGWYVADGKHLGATDEQRGHKAKPQPISPDGASSQ